MAFNIPLSRDFSTSTEFSGMAITIGKLRWNPFTYTWHTDITFDSRTYYGISVVCGINILGQFNLPVNILVINLNDVVTDPLSWGGIRLVILEKEDVKQLGEESA